jgi:LacI family transcriptional regulator
MRDVAAKAGVTPTVVSRVLHNKANTVRVSAATAERVREAASELRYRVNITARNFREQQTLMIGVLHGMGFERQPLSVGSRYFASLMDGVVDEAFRRGYSVTFCPSLLSVDPTGAISDGRFDGLIWYSTDINEQNMNLLKNCRAPLVMVHANESFGDGKVSTVICDNQQGIELGLNHLLELGHTKIGMVMDRNRSFTEAQMRREIFEQLLDKHNLPHDEFSIINAETDLSGLERYLDNPLHTGVLTTSETVAGDMVTIADRKGVKIPDDISIIGFDSTEYCDVLRPKLTSVSQPLRLMGAEAARLLIEEISDLSTRRQHLVIPCGLDIRESTTTLKKK